MSYFYFNLHHFYSVSRDIKAGPISRPAVGLCVSIAIPDFPSGGKRAPGVEIMNY